LGNKVEGLISGVAGFKIFQDEHKLVCPMFLVRVLGVLHARQMLAYGSTGPDVWIWISLKYAGASMVVWKWFI